MIPLKQLKLTLVFNGMVGQGYKPGANKNLGVRTDSFQKNWHVSKYED